MGSALKATNFLPCCQSNLKVQSSGYSPMVVNTDYTIFGIRLLWYKITTLCEWCHGRYTIPLAEVFNADILEFLHSHPEVAVDQQDMAVARLTAGNSPRVRLKPNFFFFLPTPKNNVKHFRPHKITCPTSQLNKKFLSGNCNFFTYVLVGNHITWLCYSRPCICSRGFLK